MGPDFNFALGVARDELVGIDGMFEFGRITRNAEKAQADRNDVIGKGGHFFWIFELKFSGLTKRGVKNPDAKLRELVNFDFVAVVKADVIEARKFFDEAVDEAVAIVIKARRAGVDEVVVMAAVFLREHGAGFAKHGEFFIEHGHWDIALEDLVELLARDFCKEISVKDRNAVVERALETGKFGVGVRPVLAGVFHLKFGVRGEIGESRVDGIGDECEVNGLVNVIGADAERQSEFRERKIFIGHPASNFDDFVNVRANFARMLNNRMEAIEYRTALEFWPAHCFENRRP